MTGRDESVTFSLKELAKLEDERIDQERRSREAREQAATAAREDAQRKQRAELDARDRAAAEERERARFREMEEEARREAIQRAAVEQVRITVEARTRAEESERERRHEIELQRMRAETAKKPGPGGFIGSALAGGGFALATCLVLHFAVAKPAADNRIAELDRAVASAEGRADALSSRVEDQKRTNEGLHGQLGDARAEITRLQKAALVKAPPTGGSTPPRAPIGPPPKPKTPNDGPPCPKFDPLCP